MTPENDTKNLFPEISGTRNFGFGKFLNIPICRSTNKNDRKETCFQQHFNSILTVNKTYTIFECPIIAD